MNSYLAYQNYFRQSITLSDCRVYQLSYDYQGCQSKSSIINNQDE